MKNWKKSWLNELDGKIPELRQDVKDAPINRAEAVSSSGGAAVLAKNPRTWIIISAAVVLMAAVIALAVTLSHSDKRDYFALTLEINPALTFITDGDGYVTEVISSNADADVIMTADGAEESTVGKPVAEAVRYCADSAVRLGYLDLTADGSAVRLSAEVGGESVLGEVKVGLEEYFMEIGAYAAVVAEEVSEKEFLVRCGISAVQSVSEVVGYVKENGCLYSERQTAECEVYELIAYYTDVIKQTIEDIKDKLSSIGDYIENLTEEIDWLITPPEDSDGFLEKLNAFNKLQYLCRREQFSALYDEPRAAISAEDYSSFIGGLESEYGSLSEYWKNIWKNN